MKKYIAFIATFLFFACVTVFTMQMTQDDGNADLTLTEKVTIMANAGDGGDGDEDEGGGQANLCDEIWIVTYSGTIGWPPGITVNCTTGGEYVCPICFWENN